MSRLFALIVSVAAAGCIFTHSEGDQGFVIVDNSAAPLTSCTFNGDPNQPFQTSGTLSTSSPNGYFFAPLLKSRLTFTAGMEVARTITIQGARVDLTVVSMQQVDNNGTITDLTSGAQAKLSSNVQHFQTIVTGTLPPLGNANVGFEVVPWAAIPQLTAGIDLTRSRFRAEIKAHVVVFGRLGDGDINSDGFDYGVTLCNDCVINVLGPCPSLGVTPRAGNSCNPFQDGVADCCLETGNVLRCPARTM